MPRLLQAATLALLCTAAGSMAVRAAEPEAGQVPATPELSAAERLNQQELNALHGPDTEATPPGFMGARLMLQSIDDIGRVR